jgi:hypothetical protein
LSPYYVIFLYCDVHAVGLMSQQKKKALPGNGWPRNNDKAVFSTT